SQRQATQVISGSLSGDRGKTAAAAEGPWSYPCDPPPGALANANPSRISQTDQAQAQCIGPSIVNSVAPDNAQATEYPHPDWTSYSPLNVSACVDELGTEA